MCFLRSPCHKHIYIFDGSDPPLLRHLRYGCCITYLCFSSLNGGRGLERRGGRTRCHEVYYYMLCVWLRNSVMDRFDETDGMKSVLEHWSFLIDRSCGEACRGIYFILPTKWRAERWTIWMLLIDFIHYSKGLVLFLGSSNSNLDPFHDLLRSPGHSSGSVKWRSPILGLVCCSMSPSSYVWSGSSVMHGRNCQLQSHF